MQQHSSPMMQLTQLRAESRLRHLLDELHLLMVSFSDLRAAFDADELPLAFILRRDSRLTKASAAPQRTFSPRGNNPVRRRTMSSRTHSRGVRRKQLTDE